MKKKYILCPRCELNYIPSDDPARKYCDVCLSELNLIESKLIPDDDAEMILCPKCKVNYINADEDMCESCRDGLTKNDVVVEEWTEELDNAEEAVDDEPVEISFDEVAEEEESGEQSDEPFDEEDTFNNEEEFDEVNIDEEDFDDDEEEEEDEDDLDDGDGL